jgi:hypothetical protein
MLCTIPEERRPQLHTQKAYNLAQVNLIEQNIESANTMFMQHETVIPIIKKKKIPPSENTHS